jgi:DNA-binding MarR family transcriptional regulator
MSPSARPTAPTLREPATLDELLNHRLLRLYAASVAPITRLMEARWGISRREWRLLALLEPHESMAPSMLADSAHLDRPRTSRAIGSLATKGLLARVAEPGDARRARVALTPAGRRLYAEAFPEVAAINARVVAALDDSTLRALDRALGQLTALAERLNAETVPDVRADRRVGGSRRFRP